MELAALTGTRLWLIWTRDEQTSGVRDFRRSYAPLTASWRQLMNCLISGARRAEQSPAPADGAPFPAVPASDFLLFRHDCRALLTSEELSVVEDEFRGTLETTREWVAATPMVDAETVASFLHDLIADCVWTPQALTRLRAAQVVLFLAYFNVAVDAEHFDAARPPVAAMSPQVSRALARFPAARFGAIATVSLLSSAVRSAIRDVAMSDLAADGSSFRVNDREFDVPEYARPVLRAARLQRVAEGALDDAPLFADANTGMPLSEHGVQLCMAKVALHAGVRTTRHFSRQKYETEQSTMRRLGVTVRPMRPAGVPDETP